MVKRERIGTPQQATSFPQTNQRIASDVAQFVLVWGLPGDQGQPGRISGSESELKSLSNGCHACESQYQTMWHDPEQIKGIELALEPVWGI